MQEAPRYILLIWNRLKGEGAPRALGLACRASAPAAVIEGRGREKDAIARHQSLP